MPLIEVTYDRDSLPFSDIKKLGPKLAAIVAARLSFEGVQLTEADVEVRFRERGAFDVHAPSFGVTIYANDYPDRHARVATIANDISDDIRSLRLNPRAFVRNAYVWLLLMPSGFTRLP